MLMLRWWLSQLSLRRSLSRSQHALSWRGRRQGRGRRGRHGATAAAFHPPLGRDERIALHGGADSVHQLTIHAADA
jgi:hypothetical protein